MHHISHGPNPSDRNVSKVSFFFGEPSAYLVSKSCKGSNEKSEEDGGNERALKACRGSFPLSTCVKETLARSPRLVAHFPWTHFGLSVMKRPRGEGAFAHLSGAHTFLRRALNLQELHGTQQICKPEIFIIPLA